MLKDFWAWLKGALAVVYQQDGRRGLWMLFAMLVILLVLLGVAVWQFDIDLGGIVNRIFGL